jgi:hypothetical protein
MLKWKYVFLSLSAIAFTVGFSGAGPNIYVYLGLPVGAIMFCLFLIFQFLQEESALYDEQNRAANLARLASASAAFPVQSSRRKETRGPIFTTAHSH